MRKVEVYWHSGRRLYSVREKGKVVDHVPFILLKDAQFVVQPAGRKKARETGQKNVHAFLRGYLVGDLITQYRKIKRDGGVRFVEEDNEYLSYDIFYNPFAYDQFVTTSTKSEVDKASYVEAGVKNGSPWITGYGVEFFDE